MTGAPQQAPHLPGAIVADTSGAMHLALAIMTALFARERTGEGQLVQTSALGTQLWLQQWELTHVSMTGAELERSGHHHPNIRGTYGVYATADDGAIMLATTMQQEDWDAFCVFAEVPQLAVDPRLQTPGQRLGEGITEADSEEFRRLLREAFRKKTTMQWDEFLRTLPEVIWERVRDWHEVLEDPQSIANDYFTEVDIPGAGRHRTVGNLVHLSATPGSPKGNPPQLGEGNEEILSAIGLSAAEIDEITRTVSGTREALLALLAANQPQN